MARDEAKIKSRQRAKAALKERGGCVLDGVEIASRQKLVTLLLSERALYGEIASYLDPNDVGDDKAVAAGLSKWINHVLGVSRPARKPPKVPRREEDTWYERFQKDRKK